MRRHRRRSVRLREFDYRQPGLYFVTACTFGQQPLFGDVVDGQMRLSAFAQIAQEEWTRTPSLRAGVALDAFVVMPDHVHLLFGIVADNARRGTARCAPTPDESARQFGGLKSGSIPTIVRAYKSAATRRIRQLADADLRFDPTLRVWQRGYYDRIVRHDREADAIRWYIAENPAHWHHRADAVDGHRIGSQPASSSWRLSSLWPCLRLPTSSR